MSQSDDNVNDVQFILDRVRWFSTQPPEAVFAYFKEHKMESLYSVPHPSGWGSLTCGFEAYQRFGALAKRFPSCQSEKAARVDPWVYARALRAEFVRRFVRDSQPVDRRNVDRMLSSAYRRLEHGFDSITHYIPCNIFASHAPAECEIGPVHFMRKNKFEELHATELEAHRATLTHELLNEANRAIADGVSPDRIASEAQRKQYADFLVDSVKDFFGHYDWVASVTVAKCDEQTSRRRALLAVQGALNILKLLFGRMHTDRLSTAHAPRFAADTAELTRFSNGKLNISVTKGGYGNVIGQNWLAPIHERGEFFFQAAAQTLYGLVDPQRSTHLGERFLDALAWYGDAVSEVSPAAQVVKYVCAMERITGTDKEHDSQGAERSVTDIVTTRCAILYLHSCEKSYEECRAEINKIYECRSNLVHGSVSPFEGFVSEMVYRTEDVTRLVLLRGLDFFVSLGLNDPAFSVSDLRRSYLEFEQRFGPSASQG